MKLINFMHEDKLGVTNQFYVPNYVGREVVNIEYSVEV